MSRVNVDSSSGVADLWFLSYAAKNRHRMRIARHLGTVLESLREDEIHALVEYCMDSDTGSPA